MEIILKVLNTNKNTNKNKNKNELAALWLAEKVYGMVGEDNDEKNIYNIVKENIVKYGQSI